MWGICFREFHTIPSQGLNARSWVPQIQGAVVGFGLVLFCFSCLTAKCSGFFPHCFQPCSLAAPARMRETWGDPHEDYGREERKRAEREERKHPFAAPKPSSSFKVGGKKKEKVEREAGGEEISLPPHYCSAHCKLPVAARLAPALLSPLASTPKFLTTFFPAGNINQDTFRIKKKRISE